MKKIVLLVTLSIIPILCFARDDVEEYSVEEAMSVEKVSAAIGEGISFYFAGQDHPEVKKKIGEFEVSRKTNAFGKSDKVACQWAFASVMKSLRQSALKENGNAIVNIRSTYKGVTTSSSTMFKCGAGGLMAGVALMGDVVKLQESE